MKIIPIYNFKLLPKDVLATTIYPFILFSTKKENTDYTTLKHEMVHVRQIRYLGFFRFYISYVLYYLAGLIRSKNHGLCYYDIPYEIEAYTSETMPLTESEAKELGVD